MSKDKEDAKAALIALLKANRELERLKGLVKRHPSDPEARGQLANFREKVLVPASETVRSLGYGSPTKIKIKDLKTILLQEYGYVEPETSRQAKPARQPLRAVEQPDEARGREKRREKAYTQREQTRTSGLQARRRAAVSEVPLMAAVSEVPLMADVSQALLVELQELIQNPKAPDFAERAVLVLPRLKDGTIVDEVVDKATIAIIESHEVKKAVEAAHALSDMSAEQAVTQAGQVINRAQASATASQSASQLALDTASSAMEDNTTDIKAGKAAEIAQAACKAAKEAAKDAENIARYAQQQAQAAVNAAAAAVLAAANTPQQDAAKEDLKKAESVLKVATEHTTTAVKLAETTRISLKRPIEDIAAPKAVSSAARQRHRRRTEGAQTPPKPSFNLPSPESAPTASRQSGSAAPFVFGSQVAAGGQTDTAPDSAPSISAARPSDAFRPEQAGAAESDTESVKEIDQEEARASEAARGFRTDALDARLRANLSEERTAVGIIADDGAEAERAAHVTKLQADLTAARDAVRISEAAKLAAETRLAELTDSLTRTLTEERAKLAVAEQRVTELETATRRTKARTAQQLAAAQAREQAAAADAAAQIAAAQAHAQQADLDRKQALKIYKDKEEDLTIQQQTLMSQIQLETQKAAAEKQRADKAAADLAVEQAALATARTDLQAAQTAETQRATQAAAALAAATQKAADDLAAAQAALATARTDLQAARAAEARETQRADKAAADLAVEQAALATARTDLQAAQTAETQRATQAAAALAAATQRVNIAEAGLALARTAVQAARAAEARETQRADKAAADLAVEQAALATARTDLQAAQTAETQRATQAAAALAAATQRVNIAEAGLALARTAVQAARAAEARETQRADNATANLAPETHRADQAAAALAAATQKAADDLAAAQAALATARTDLQAARAAEARETQRADKAAADLAVEQAALATARTDLQAAQTAETQRATQAAAALAAATQRVNIAEAGLALARTAVQAAQTAQAAETQRATQVAANLRAEQAALATARTDLQAAQTAARDATLAEGRAVLAETESLESIRLARSAESRALRQIARATLNNDPQIIFDAVVRVAQADPVNVAAERQALDAVISHASSNTVQSAMGILQTIPEAQQNLQILEIAVIKAKAAEILKHPFVTQDIADVNTTMANFAEGINSAQTAERAIKDLAVSVRGVLGSPGDPVDPALAAVLLKQVREAIISPVGRAVPGTILESVRNKATIDFMLQMCQEDKRESILKKAGYATITLAKVITTAVVVGVACACIATALTTGVGAAALGVAFVGAVKGQALSATMLAALDVAHPVFMVASIAVGGTTLGKKMAESISYFFTRNTPDQSTTNIIDMTARIAENMHRAGIDNREIIGLIGSFAQTAPGVKKESEKLIQEVSSKCPALPQDVLRTAIRTSRPSGLAR